MTHHAQADVLSRLAIPDVAPLAGRRAAFLGCGDSLAAARPAEQLGHRVLSAGDVAWGGGAPRGVDVAVALSSSGRTGATIRAARIAKAAGLSVIAVTTNPSSPLADLADQIVAVPSFDLAEEIPAVGYAVHSAAVAMLAGEHVDLAQVAADWSAACEAIRRLRESSGSQPEGITVATTADAHGTGEFWMLKLIEATGLTARTTGVEELGHVDYFIGPQQHLALILAGEADSARATALGDALATNGQQVVQVRLADFTSLTGWPRQVLGGVVGADYSALLASGWNRPYFRGGTVDMSARHIQVPVP